MTGGEFTKKGLATRILKCPLGVKIRLYSYHDLRRGTLTAQREGLSSHSNFNRLAIISGSS